MMIERIEINLLPAEYRVHKRSFKLHRGMVYSILVIILGSLVAALMTFWQQSEISTIENDIKTIDEQIKQNKPIQAEINKLRLDKSAIDEKIRALERISVNREKWVRLMEVLSGCLPAYSWIHSVQEEAGPPPVLRIEGRTFSFPEVANFMTRLQESEYITGVELSGIEQIGGEQRVYRFLVSAFVNPDAQLESLFSELL